MNNKIFRAFKCPHCKAPIYWAVKVASDNIHFYLNIVFAVFLGASVIMNSVQHRKINKLETMIADQEYYLEQCTDIDYCIEQCKESFIRMGC